MQRGVGAHASNKVAFGTEKGGYKVTWSTELKLAKTLPATGSFTDLVGEKYLPLGLGVDNVFQQMDSKVGRRVAVAGGFDEWYRVLDLQ